MAMKQDAPKKRYAKKKILTAAKKPESNKFLVLDLDGGGFLSSEANYNKPAFFKSIDDALAAIKKDVGVDYLQDINHKIVEVVAGYDVTAEATLSVKRV